MPFWTRTPPAFTSWPTIWQLKWNRTAKYKQRRQILGRTHLQGLANIQIGACTGLSYGWVQRHRQNPTESAGNRCESLNSDAAYNNHNYLAGVFNSATAGASHPARLETVAHHALGTPRANVVHLNTQNFTTFAPTLAHLDANPGYHLVNMLMVGSGTGHVIAMHQSATHLTVFDPNLGEFTVSNANRRAFFADLVHQYNTYISATGVVSPKVFSDWDIAFVG